MAQPNQVTPTMQANLAGASTTVNLRDWLNTRLSPFLKKAIIESLDSEAQYPLQWLGEQLIQQSIMFEGNPDTTNIRERFLYKHPTETNTAQAPGSTSAPGLPVEQAQQQQPAPSQPAQATMPDIQSVPAVQTEQSNPAFATPSTTDPNATLPEQVQSLPSVPAVNGTAQPEINEQNRDTEMSNAT